MLALWEFLENLWTLLREGLMSLALAVIFRDFVPAGSGVRRA